MGTTGKLQEYPYSFKTVSTDSGKSTTCNYRMFFRIYPPEDLLQTKNLYCQFYLEFASGSAVSDRYITSVGVVSNVPASITATPTRVRRITLNRAADANRYVEVAMDLSHMIDEDGTNWVEIIVPATAFNSGSNWGSIKLWKLDMLYTSKGVR